MQPKMRLMNGTTEGISLEDVQAAMTRLGIHNPKPGIPLEQTITGHEIVALACQFDSFEERIAYLEQVVEALRPAARLIGVFLPEKPI